MFIYTEREGEKEREGGETERATREKARLRGERESNSEIGERKRNI